MAIIAHIPLSDAINKSLDFFWKLNAQSNGKKAQHINKQSMHLFTEVTRSLVELRSGSSAPLAHLQRKSGYRRLVNEAKRFNTDATCFSEASCLFYFSK